jgi:hypothetical protein
MEKEKEYEKHVKECLTFAQRTTDATLGQDNKEIRKEVLLSIFDKVCTPLYYFLQGEPATQPPTERQIEYARHLGITEPEKYSRQQLSDEIDKAKRQKEEAA